MHARRTGRPVSGLMMAGMLMAGLAAPACVVRAQQPDVQAALQKANAYIEVAKRTERAADSWDRYASWVNMKTGPTGKERYISYGMYEVYDLEGPFTEGRAAAQAEPALGTLDASMIRYIEAYEAVAPLLNQGAAYYDREGYKSDNIAEGKALHGQMVPLVETFLAERNAMMPALRAFARNVEGLELAAIKARDGQSAAWHVGNLLHTANRVMDVFPRERPVPMDSETLDAKIEALGPQSSGAEFEAVMAGVVPPTPMVIDVERYGEALEVYAEAVGTFDGFTGEKPEDFDEFKPLPRQLLDALRAFHAPLMENKGREFDGGAQMMNQIVQVYFAMFNAGNGMTASRLSYLP
jgi:hypothetical protein